MKKTDKNQWAKVWKMPLILALFTLTGLLAALFGTGIWDVVSWISLGAVCIITGRKVLVR